MISFVVWAYGISKKLEYIFWDGAGYQLTELSGQAGFGWRERGGYCRLDAGVEIETRLVESIRSSFGDHVGLMKSWMDIWGLGVVQFSVRSISYDA
jgi:hypothetical protein